MEEDEVLNQLEAALNGWEDGFACLIRGLRHTPLLRFLGLALLPAEACGVPLAELAGVLGGGACRALETLRFNYAAESEWGAKALAVALATAPCAQI